MCKIPGFTCRHGDGDGTAVAVEVIISKSKRDQEGIL
jgi:hypothetical protein